ncbi:MAG: hypothetical protein ACXAEX_02055 [Promethearchaeota archaeon]|jgi:hypothetical protein
MVEAVLIEPKLKEELEIPNLKVEGKENVDQYFKLLLAGTPHLKFSIIDKRGKELYSNLLNVEMR